MTLFSRSGSTVQAPCGRDSFKQLLEARCEEGEIEHCFSDDNSMACCQLHRCSCLDSVQVAQRDDRLVLCCIFARLQEHLAIVEGETDYLLDI